MAGTPDRNDRNRGPGADAGGSTPGVDVRRSDLLDADVRISDPSTGPRAHRALLDAGLDEWLLDALAELPGERGDCREWLLEAGADAIDGAWTRVAADAASAIAYAEQRDLEVDVDGLDADRDDAPAGEPIATALETARAIGTGGTPLGVPSSRADLASGTPPIFRLALSTTPRIAVELSGAWFARSDREQREDVLELLLALGEGCEVVLRPTTIAARRLHEQHREQLPTSVTERLDPGRPAPAHARGEAPERVLDVVEDAREALDPDGTAAAVLRALRDSQSDSLSYVDLRRELRLEGSHPRVLAYRLEDLGLVERLERSDGRVSVSLLPAGQRLLEEWRDAVGEQSAFCGDTVPDPAPDAGRSSRGRYAPPKKPLPCRVSPPEHGEAPQDPAADAAAEAARGDSPDRTDRYAHGAVALGFMDRARHAAVAGSARSGEVSLVNAELEPMLEKCGDGREPAWSFDPREDVLVAGAEFHNPMQYWTSIARALASPRTWQNVLDEDRVGDELQELATDDVELLRGARCIGWLPNEAAEDRDRLVDELGDAYEELLELTARLKAGDYEDRDAFRGEILRHALGLAGSMSHLLDLAGVEVVREVRIPEFSDKFSKGGHSDRRRDLCRTIAIGAAIQSRYGHFAAFRQLLEDRPEKIDQALEPTVDVDDPLAELHGSIVVSGHGVEDLEGELRSMLEHPKKLREDAPELAVRIPVRLADSPATTKRVAEVVARSRRLELPREAIVALHGFTCSPYAVAEAIAALGREDLRREMFLDEVRFGLSNLDDEQLLPDGSPAARDGLLALLRAEEPISQAELARRADISTQSWRNHRDALVAAGLVEETPDGWRCTLPFKSERYDEDALEDVADPWILDVETQRLPGGASTRSALDVVEELAHCLDAYGDPVVDDALSWPIDDRPPPGRALEAMGCGILERFVEAHVPRPDDVEPPAALLGPELTQLSIRTLQHPQKSPTAAQSD